MGRAVRIAVTGPHIIPRRTRPGIATAAHRHQRTELAYLRVTAPVISPVSNRAESAICSSLSIAACGGEG
jgi:hypothetical protein